MTTHTNPASERFTAGVALVVACVGESRYDNARVIDDPHQPSIADVLCLVVGAGLADLLKE